MKKKADIDFELDLKQKYIRYVIMYVLFFILFIAFYNDTKFLLYALLAAIMLTSAGISFIMLKNKKMIFKEDKFIYTDIFGNEEEYNYEDMSYRKTDVAYKRGRYITTINMVSNYKFYINNKEIIMINDNIFSIIDVKKIEEIIKVKKIKEHTDESIDTKLKDNPIKDKDIQYEIKPSRVILIANLIAAILFLYIAIIFLIFWIVSTEIELFIISLFTILVTVYFFREFFKLKNNKIVYIKNKGIYRKKGLNSKYYDLKNIKTYNLKKYWINDVYREIILFMDDKTTITITSDSYGFFELLDGLKIER